MSLYWQSKTYNFSTIPESQPFSGNIVVYNTVGSQANLSVISGSLPANLFLTTGAVNNNTIIGTISGTPNIVAFETASNFVVRASDGTGNISDCTVSITVFGAYPPIPYPAGNIGIFPDGTYINTSISAVDLNPNANLTYILLNPTGSTSTGILPPGLSLDANTGNITGYAQPSILTSVFPFGFDQTLFDGNITPNPFQPGFDSGNITSNVSFVFSVAVSDGNLANAATYSMTIERFDIYNGTNYTANLSLPNYHSPVLLDTEFNGNSPYINLGTISTNRFYYYQFNALDFDPGENGSVGFELTPAANVFAQTPQYFYNAPIGNISSVNANINPIVIAPANLSLNGNSGWLTGYIQPAVNNLTNYAFNVRTFKTATENWTNTYYVDYATYLPFTALNYADQLTIDAAVLDLPSTNFDGKTILFMQQATTGFANTYQPGNTAPSVFSNITLYTGPNTSVGSTSFGWTSFYNPTTGNVGPIVNNNVFDGNISITASYLVWQFTRNAANTIPNPRFGNVLVSSANSVNAFYTLSPANISVLHAANPSSNVVLDIYNPPGVRIIPEKLITIQSTNNLVNNTVQFLYPVQNYTSLPTLPLGNPANVAINPYQSLTPVNLSLNNYSEINIEWITPANLGVLLPGEVCNYRLEATVNNWVESVGAGATAQALMVLNSANLVNAGSNYQTGDILTVSGGVANISATIQVGNVGTGGSLISALLVNPGINYQAGDVLTVAGGTYANAANIVVLSVANGGQIQTYNVSFAGVQYSVLPNIVSNMVTGGSGSGATFSLIFTAIGQILDYTINYQSSGYSVLPPVSNNPVTNGSGNTASFNLSFGVGSINVLTPGNYYNGATIGFSECAETMQAKASPQISNKLIQAINISNTGAGYQVIPSVLIGPINSTHPENIINYQLISNNLPMGLTLQSNGIITGRPLFQNQNITNVFTVSAEITQNSPIIVYEPIATNNINPPSHTQDSTQIISVTQTFEISVLPANLIPISNMYLEFMLSQTDSNLLFAPIYDQTIVSSTDIYRWGDPNFGIPSDVKMLMAYGLLTPTDENVDTIISEYHYIKDYYFTDINWACATDNNGNVQYEVIYLTPKDIYTNGAGESFSGNLTIFENGTAIIVQPATIPNMIAQLQLLGSFNPAYLPSWMTSIQPNGLELGWIQAVPILYVNPGAGLKILNRLKNYYAVPTNNLNQICATADRYLWDNDLALYYDKDAKTFGNVIIEENYNKYAVFPQQTNYLNNGAVNV